MEHYEIQVVGHLDQRRAQALGCESLRLLPDGRSMLTFARHRPDGAVWPARQAAGRRPRARRRGPHRRSGLAEWRPPRARVARRFPKEMRT